MATDVIRVVTEKKEKAKEVVSNANSKFKCCFELTFKNNTNLQDIKEILSWLKERYIWNLGNLTAGGGR